jgi:hypothetical protein
LQRCCVGVDAVLQAPEERKRIKLLLAAQEQLFPDVHGNLLQVYSVLCDV